MATTELLLVPVRATVNIGGMAVKTPFVTSFNVNRSRGQSATFSATLKVHYNSIANAVGGDVTISAGPAGSENLIFTGICRSSNVTPCRDDPAYILLTVSGNDILSELQNKKITRRCKSSAATWVEITGVVRGGLKEGKLAYVKAERNLEMDPMNTRNEDPVTHSVATNIPKDGLTTKTPRKVQDRPPTPKVTEITSPEAGGDA